MMRKTALTRDGGGGCNGLRCCGWRRTGSTSGGVARAVLATLTFTVLASVGRGGVGAGSLPVLGATATRLAARAVESPGTPVAVHWKCKKGAARLRKQMD